MRVALSGHRDREYTMLDDELAAIASRIDEALAFWEHSKHIVFTGYPRGCCGSASELLATYLRDRHEVDATYCSGKMSDDGMRHHAWIEVGATAIDLTCRQFQECPCSAVYVGRLGDWHRKWSVTRKPWSQVPSGQQHWQEVYDSVLILTQ